MGSSIVGVLLAAGQSRRFGSNKLLCPVQGDTPMVVVCARRMLAAMPQVVAVVADPQDRVATLLQDEGLILVQNDRASEGMGASIACGVASCSSAAGWVIGLGDMPYVPAYVFDSVVSGLAGGAELVAPAYQGRRGHPVGFSARHRAALLRLGGDLGARQVLRDNKDALLLLEVPDPGVLEDVDTPGALRRF